MHLSGIGQTVYGPQLPCCPNAATAEAGALESGVPCDPNCLEGYTPEEAIKAQEEIIEAYRMEKAIASMYPKPSSQWFPGVSNTAVLLVGVGLGALLLLGRRR